ncbi:MAG: hypothetical protein IT178_07755 [Acidobacteria bacterium]|nr:hypothetical protein [Acidobacteriota bacterium]
MMRASVVVAIVAALVAPMDAQRPLPTADELAARVRAYLVDYETQLSMLVADEAMEQFVEMNLSHRARRRLRSEVVFMRLPGDSSWLAHRAVVTVDGQAAGAGRARLMELLSASGVPDLDKARLMVAEAQSYKLGLSRTINVPTIALDLLHPRLSAVI